jgi:hypothetical protein
MNPIAQYLISVLADTTDPATAEEMAAIDVFNEQLQADGHWVFAGGLGSPSTATVIDGRPARPPSSTVATERRSSLTGLS